MKARRKEIGLSAERVAELLGVSPATIYRYENGDIEKVPGSRLEPIATALQTTPSALMGWTDKHSKAIADQLCGKVEKPTPHREDGLNEEETELVRLYKAASPALRAAALAVLKSSEGQGGVPGEVSATE